MTFRFALFVNDYAQLPTRTVFFQPVNDNLNGFFCFLKMLQRLSPLSKSPLRLRHAFSNSRTLRSTIDESARNMYNRGSDCTFELRQKKTHIAI